MFTNDELFIMRSDYQKKSKEAWAKANEKGLKKDSHGDMYGSGYFDLVAARKYDAIFEKLDTMWNQSNLDKIELMRAE